MARHYLLNLSRDFLLVMGCILLPACYDPESIVYNDIFETTNPLNGQCFSMQTRRVESVVVANDEYDLSFPSEYIFFYSDDQKCVFFLNDKPLLFFPNGQYNVRADIKVISRKALLAADTRGDCVASVLVHGSC